MRQLEQMLYAKIETCYVILLHLLQVVDLVEDLRDGTVLCSLVEALQGRKLKGWSSNPSNQHQKLDNCTTALQAIEEDGVKLVNIGKRITKTIC